jgi:prepilin-type N-terminal cleavage/methylation domain-containing protein
MTRSPRRASAGFTLLEIIIALGILAIGATTALALLVAATSTGRRAEHLVNSALVADSVLAEVEGDLTGSFGPKSLEGLEVVTPAERRSSGLGDGPLRAAPFLDPNNDPRNAPGPKPRPAPGATGPEVRKAPSPSPKGAKAPSPSPSPSPKADDDPQATGSPPRAFDEDPFAERPTVWYEKDKSLAAYPDYKYDVALTPIGGPPDDPWEFLVEVVVRWSEKGSRRDALYQTVFLKKLSALDVKPQ